jgi:two-component system OmpR family sensor kinase
MRSWHHAVRLSQERLTRQELSWLLAQEARGAAKALREGVSALTQPPRVDITTAPNVETNLDALDEAIGRLSELQMGTASVSRRGRIDLAALLCEVAPHARIGVETSSGTEVFGEESELRRMIHLLLSQSNSGPGDTDSSRTVLTIKRDGPWVRISVELGPDQSATAEIERRWLSRMATRHGGRLELEGGTETIILPSDGSGDEVAELRRELEQAQQLGEAYARELAAVVAAGDLPQEPTPSQPPPPGADRFEALVASSSAIVRTLRGWIDSARVDVAEAVEKLGMETDLAQRLNKRMGRAQELLTELERIANCPLDEGTKRHDVAQELREAVSAAESRAARHSISIQVVAPPKLEVDTRRSVLGLVLRCLIDHAIAATPRDDGVKIVLEGQGAGFVLRMEDGGPTVPAVSRLDLLRRRVDPTSVGRPEGLALPVAEAGAALLGARMGFAETGEGRSEVVLTHL